jgi:uncharacterized protein YjbI with pentapeptide repeats
MAKEGTLEWANQLLRGGATGVSQWNQWRQRRGSFLDLSGIALNQAQPRGVNLREIELWDAQFEGADLTRAQLAGAYLDRANLPGAQLIEYNLGSTNLRGATLRAAIVAGSQLALCPESLTEAAGFNIRRTAGSTRRAATFRAKCGTPGVRFHGRR